ncbi:hypothetical protein SAMD00019534_005870, partial [Acytostelium subglobosum LB1]|uniref:hypothetical protein n=1 Tax=Acytostelium subglobosum LB1 TaxID=1410327 RepID=UPI0006450245
ADTVCVLATKRVGRVACLATFALFGSVSDRSSDWVASINSAWVVVVHSDIGVDTLSGLCIAAGHHAHWCRLRVATSALGTVG